MGAHPLRALVTIRECHCGARQRRCLRSTQDNARAAPGRLAITAQFPGDYYVESDGTPLSPESTLAGTSSPAPAPAATRFPMPHEPQRTPLHDRVAGLQQVRPGSNRISSAAPHCLKLTSYGQMFPLATMSLFPCRVPITEPSRIHIAAGWFSMGSETGQDCGRACSSHLGRFLCHGGNASHG